MYRHTCQPKDSPCAGHIFILDSPLTGLELSHIGEVSSLGTSGYLPVYTYGPSLYSLFYMCSGIEHKSSCLQSQHLATETSPQHERLQCSQLPQALEEAMDFQGCPTVRMLGKSVESTCSLRLTVNKDKDQATSRRGNL